MERNLLYREFSAGLQAMPTVPVSHFSEQEIKGVNLKYLDIGVGGRLPARTGVCIPQRFQPGVDGVDVVVYFHGHVIAACGNNSQDFARKGIEHYWQTENFRCLWEEFAMAGSNAVLLAPTLGIYSSREGQYGALGESYGFDQFIESCFNKLSFEGILPGGARPRNIILAGHSGGGKPINAVLMAKNQLGAKIVECWGFDSQYFNASPLRNWLKANPNKRYYHYAAHSYKKTDKKYTRSGPWLNAEALVKSPLANAYNITPSPGEILKHCRVVRRWWATRVRDCAWLHNKSNRELDSESPSLLTQLADYLYLPGTVLSALARGVKDENVLTDLIFHFRHPELRGRSLRADDPKTLGNEWVTILQKMVRPLLAKMHDTSAGKSAGDSTDGFELYTYTLSKSPMTFVRKSDQQEVKKSPWEFAREIVRNAGFNPDEWFKSYTRITFLGRKLNDEQFLHVAAARRLKAAEQYFLKRYGSEAEAVRQLNLTNEKIAASRKLSSTATTSMHLFGLAVDVNYLGNPFVESGDIPILNSVLEHAAHLLGENLSKYKHNLAYEQIAAIDQQIERYFKLLDNAASLQGLLSTQIHAPWKGLTLSKAQDKIESDLKTLATKLARGGDKAKYVRYGGILNHTKAFIDGMRLHGFHWGGSYGDMMHFDLRIEPEVGKKIENARLAFLSQFTKK